MQVCQLHPLWSVAEPLSVWSQLPLWRRRNQGWVLMADIITRKSEEVIETWYCHSHKWRRQVWCWQVNSKWRRINSSGWPDKWGRNNSGLLGAMLSSSWHDSRRRNNWGLVLAGGTTHWGLRDSGDHRREPGGQVPQCVHAWLTEGQRTDWGSVWLSWWGQGQRHQHGAGQIQPTVAVSMCLLARCVVWMPACVNVLDLSVEVGY